MTGGPDRSGRFVTIDLGELCDYANKRATWEFVHTLYILLSAPRTRNIYIIAVDGYWPYDHKN